MPNVTDQQPRRARPRVLRGMLEAIVLPLSCAALFDLLIAGHDLSATPSSDRRDDAGRDRIQG